MRSSGLIALIALYRCMMLITFSSCRLYSCIRFTCNIGNIRIQALSRAQEGISMN